MKLIGVDASVPEATYRELPLRTAVATIFLITLIFLSGCAHVPPSQSQNAPFQYSTDTFAFANETVWHYADGKHQEAAADEKNAYKFSRRCFVMSRAAVQFWKFARFEPGQKPLNDAELANRIRAITERDVWQSELPTDQRVIIPGYRNLRELSAAKSQVVQQNIGLGWPTYFRPGNMCMIFPVSRAHQERTERELEENLRHGQPTILWLYNFPHIDMNHTVVVWAKDRNRPNPRFLVADPNYTDGPRHLIFNRQTRTFEYEKTFYFPGGAVSARPVYLSPLQ